MRRLATQFQQSTDAGLVGHKVWMSGLSDKAKHSESSAGSNNGPEMMDRSGKRPLDP